jgi:hypothetical protein
MWMLDWGPKILNAFNIHAITMMTTTTFKIVLIFLSMGMNVLMSHSTTPAMTRAIRIDKSDMIGSFPKG